MLEISNPFSIVHLPTSYPDPVVLRNFALKYRNLRLRALLTDPDAYATSNHETEAQTPVEDWEQRVTNNLARIFVILSPKTAPLQTTANEESSFDVIEQSDWIGSLVSFGPGPSPDNSSDTIEQQLSVAKSPFQLYMQLVQPLILGTMPLSSSKSHNKRPLLYFIKDVFVEPSFRGHGLGKKLLTSALMAARDETDSLGPTGRAVALLAVDKSNPSARALYIGRGFNVVVEEPYTRTDGRSDVGLFLSKTIS